MPSISIVKLTFDYYHKCGSYVSCVLISVGQEEIFEIREKELEEQRIAN